MRTNTLTAPTPVNRIVAANHDDFAEAIQALHTQYDWLVTPIQRACKAVRNLYFYRWLDTIESADEFAHASKQLYFYASAHNSHPNLDKTSEDMFLLRWMLKQGVIDHPEQLNETLVSKATNACINLAYRTTFDPTYTKPSLTVRYAINRCMQDFFNKVTPKMYAIGAPDSYFDMQVDSEDLTSFLSLEYLEPIEANSAEARQVVASALEAISLWASMLHSWIGMSVHPKFDIHGNLLSK